MAEIWQPSDAVFLRRLLSVVAVVALALALWQVVEVLLLVFGAVLIAIALNGIADPLRRAVGGSRRLAVSIVALLIVSAIGMLAWLFGSTVATQLGEVARQLPDAVEQLASPADLQALGTLLERSSIGELLKSAYTLSTGLFASLAGALLVLAGGIYLAIDPARYREGLLAMVPPASTFSIRAALDECALALRKWLLGQLLAMALVGLMTAAGLWLLGVPAYIGLGIIAGLLEFIPIVGPIAGAIPAILLATTKDITTVLSVVALFVFIQQVENNAIMPIVTGRALLMPPAVGLFAVVALGVLLGPIGILFAYPLAGVIDVLVRQLYVRELLGKRTTLPSEVE